MWHKAAERKLEDEVKRAEEERARANADMGGLGATNGRGGGGGGGGGGGPRVGTMAEWNAVYLDSYLSFLVAIADGRNVEVLKVRTRACMVLWRMHASVSVCVCVCMRV